MGKKNKKKVAVDTEFKQPDTSVGEVSSVIETEVLTLVPVDSLISEELSIADKTVKLAEETAEADKIAKNMKVALNRAIEGRGKAMQIAQEANERVTKAQEVKAQLEKEAIQLQEDINIAEAEALHTKEVADAASLVAANLLTEAQVSEQSLLELQRTQEELIIQGNEANALLEQALTVRNLAQIEAEEASENVEQAEIQLKEAAKEASEKANELSAAAEEVKKEASIEEDDTVNVETPDAMNINPVSSSSATGSVGGGGIISYFASWITRTPAASTDSQVTMSLVNGTSHEESEIPEFTINANLLMGNMEGNSI